MTNRISGYFDFDDSDAGDGYGEETIEHEEGSTTEIPIDPDNNLTFCMNFNVTTICDHGSTQDSHQVPIQFTFDEKSGDWLAILPTANIVFRLPTPAL